MASGGEFVNIDEKVLECKICHKRLHEPRTLKCLHSFCLGCLDNWLKTMNKVTCPACSKSYQIPEGGLKKLPPNTFLNNLLQTIEQFENTDQTKCICGKEGKSKTYCQDCRRYLCHDCSDPHKNIPACKHHKLHSVEEVQSMSVSEINDIHPPMCSIHNEPLTLFCEICKVFICMSCSVNDHKEQQEKHKITRVTDMFKTFKQTSTELEKVARQCTDNLNNDLKVMTDHFEKLNEMKKESLRGIDNHVEELVTRIKCSGENLKREVGVIYTDMNNATYAKIADVTTTISFLQTNINFLHHLGKGNEARAILPGNDVIKTLDDTINEVHEINVKNTEIKFVKNSKQAASLNEDIGIVTSRSRAKFLEIRGAESMTTGQTNIKIIKIDECEINANDITATLTQPTGDTIIPEVEEDINGDYTVIGRCTSAGIFKVDVTVDGEHIKKSPVSINVENEGLLKTIKIDTVGKVYDVVKYNNNCLLVSCNDNSIHKYEQQSGENIGKVTLSEGVKVNRMYTMNNGNIAFSDIGNNCITLCTINSELVKSFGKGDLKFPWGIHVDEASRIIYVADHDNVTMFNIQTSKLIKKIAHCEHTRMFMNAIDVTLNRQENVLALHYDNGCLTILDKDGALNQVLVYEGDENGKLKWPRGVVVDDDNNIIISSNHKLQLFNNSGMFIKRIDKDEDRISRPCGLTIISQCPRRLAVVNKGDKTIKIFNY